MGTITAQAIVDEVESELLDETNVRYSEAELLGYLNDGQRQISSIKHEAYIKNTAVLLVTGTKQTLPSDGLIFINATRNMGTNGSTPGKSVRKGMMSQMDVMNPDWHTDTANSVVEQVFPSPLDFKNYYVYPKQPSSSPGYIELIYGAVPADVAAIGNAITIDDIYKYSLNRYMLSRAHSKSIPEASKQKADQYYVEFERSIDRKTLSEEKIK